MLAWPVELEKTVTPSEQSEVSDDQLEPEPTVVHAMPPLEYETDKMPKDDEDK